MYSRGCSESSEESSWHNIEQGTHLYAHGDSLASARIDRHLDQLGRDTLKWVSTLRYQPSTESTYAAVSVYNLATLTTDERKGLEQGRQCRQWVGQQLYRHHMVVARHVCRRNLSTRVSRGERALGSTHEVNGGRDSSRQRSGKRPVFFFAPSLLTRRSFKSIPRPKVRPAPFS